MNCIQNKIHRFWHWLGRNEVIQETWWVGNGLFSGRRCVKCRHLDNVKEMGRTSNFYVHPDYWLHNCPVDHLYLLPHLNVFK